MILGHCNEPHSGLVALLTGLPALFDHLGLDCSPRSKLGGKTGH